MPGESDFVALLEAYREVLAEPDTKISEIRPLVDEQIEQMLEMLPRVSRDPIRSKISIELDRIESQAQEKAVAAAAAAERAEAEAMKKGANGLPYVLVVSSPEDAAKPLNKLLSPGDYVLLKASRKVALERLIPLLKAL